MGLAGLLERKDGHEDGKDGHRAVFENLLEAYPLRGSKTAAIDVHVEKIGARNATQEPQQQQSNERGPDLQAPANQEQQAQNDFGKRQRIGDKGNARGREQLVRFNLDTKICEIGGNGKLQHEEGPEHVVGEEDLRDACINEDDTENDTSNPDDDAAIIERGGLHHEVSAYF